MTTDKKEMIEGWDIHIFNYLIVSLYNTNVLK